MQNKKLIYIVGAIVVVAVTLIILYATGIISPGLVKKVTFQKTPQVVEENLVIPDTQSIAGGEGRIIEQGSVAVPLVPKNDGEKVIVTKAVLTVKGSYDLAKPEADKWAIDNKLVFIKSLGAVTLEGKSSQWQLAFSSKTKPKKGYEVIIQADKIVSQKEIDSTAVGADIPKNFSDRDAVWAIGQLASIPQFQSSSISAISFVYNYDAKAWDYIIVNSFGNSSIRVK